MPSHDAGLQILKQDARGRVRVPREKREQILDEFERSGMTGCAFAAQIGVKYPTFAGWRLRRSHSRRSQAPSSAPSKSTAPAAFIRVHPPEGPGGLELVLPSSLRVVLSGPSQVTLAVELIRALGSC